MNKLTEKTYLIKNLDCAHCASKIEKSIAEMPEVNEAVLTFTTRKLKVTAVHDVSLFEKIKKKCADIEPGAELTEESLQKEASHEEENESSELALIISGAVIFAAALLCEKLLDSQIISSVLFLISYLILGGKILVSSAKSISKGKIFNENFLMSVATIAAFAIREYPEAVGVMLFFRIGEYFEDRAVEKSRRSVMSAIDMRPDVINLVKDNNQIVQVSPETVKPQDIILVRPGDRIPLDGVVIEGKSSLDTSSLTGEHMPESVKPGDSVMSGCVNTQGLIKIKVTKVLAESMVTRIINSVENAAAGKPKLDRFISRFANVYTPVVVIVAFLTAIIPSLITGEWHRWIYTAVTFLVISCPCAIVLSVPLTFFSGIGAGSKKGILFKSGSSIEAVRRVKAVIMDKTGTITTGKFSVNHIDLYNGFDETRLIKFCASCEVNSTHPVAAGIVEKAREKGIHTTEPENVTEYAGMGISAVIDGSNVLCGNVKLMNKSGIDVSEYISSKTGTDIICAVDGKLAGCFRISDMIKPESYNMIKYMKSRLIKTVMLTGDSEESAAAVAKDTGIEKYFSKLLPDDKLEKMKNIRKEYGPVMFIGDGINDAPVLAGADVSAAMGSGADAAVESADIVFMNSNIDSVSKAIQISDDTNKIVLQNIIFALVFKAAVMILGLAGFANMWFAVFSDTGVALLCVLNSIRILRKKY